LTYPNGDFKLPGRSASLLTLKCRGGRRIGKVPRKGGFLTVEGRQALTTTLSSDLGLSPRSARILASRPLKEIVRLEEEVRGILDSLLLFDTDFFLEENKSVQNHLLRSVLKVGTYGADSVTDDWKEFTNVCWIRISRGKTEGDPSLHRGNLFRFLLRYPKLERIIREGLGNKRDAEAIAHLVSTRQLVAGGKSKVVKALSKFKTTTKDEFVLDEGTLKTIERTASQIGLKVGRVAKPLPDFTAHISLSGAGSLTSTILDGGRRTEILREGLSLLRTRCLKTGILRLPFGVTLRERSGYQRFQCWCRERPLPMTEVMGEIDIEKSVSLEFIRFNVYGGLDEALGRQLFAAAVYTAVEKGFIGMDGEVLRSIPARSIAIPEPGGKARIVTTTPWWVVIITQPAGHCLREWLRFHPSAVAGLERADQAWLYLNLISKVKPVADGLVLSSDLEEATDAIPTKVAEALLKGFTSALGINSKWMMHSINLAVSERFIELEVNEYFVKRRGVLMGEPMTKAILTLIALAAEEKAIRDYLELPYQAVQVSWRAFAVGGDDHIAYGPYGYLKEITANLKRWGCKISPLKHAISGEAVKYCEKILLLKDRDLFIRPSQVNRSAESYDRSIFVDSIKVRLLSPISKSIEVQDDRNIAIGKAKSFGRTILWMNPSVFDRKWLHLVRARFCERMRHYLPKEGTRLYSQIMLPQDLGGLGLGFKDELPELIAKSPEATKQFVVKLLRGSATMRERILFKSFTRNVPRRGGPRALDLQLFYDLSAGKPEPIAEARDRLGISADTPLRFLTKELARRRLFTFERMEDVVFRPVVFKELLLMEGPPESKDLYNTEPWRSRYQRLWEETFEINYVHQDIIDRVVKRTEVCLDVETVPYQGFLGWVGYLFRRAIRLPEPVRLVDVSYEVETSLYKPGLQNVVELENIDRYLPIYVYDLSQPEWKPFWETAPALRVGGPDLGFRDEIPMPFDDPISVTDVRASLEPGAEASALSREVQPEAEPLVIPEVLSFDDDF